MREGWCRYLQPLLLLWVSLTWHVGWVDQSAGPSERCLRVIEEKRGRWCCSVDRDVAEGTAYFGVARLKFSGDGLEW